MSKIFQHFYDNAIAPQQSFTRATSAAYVTAQGRLALAGADVPRFEADGLLLEPAAQQYLPEPVGMNGPLWTTVSGISAPTGLSLWGLFPGLRVTSDGSFAAQHCCSISRSFAAGDAMAFNVLLGGSFTLTLRNGSAGTTSSVTGSDLTVESSDAGALSMLGASALADGAVLVYGVMTWAEAGTALEISAGPASAQQVENCVLYGMNLTSLPVPTSFILGANRAADALGPIALYEYPPLGPAALPPPFAWNDAAYPLGLSGLETAPQITLAPRDVVNPAIFTGPAFYADSSQADNSGDGLTALTAKRDISECVLLGNAAAQPYRVLIEAGDYFRRESINGDGVSVEPTQPCGFIAQNGRVRHVAGTDVPYSLHSGTTHAGPHSTAAMVLDRLDVDANGVYATLESAADIAACIATPNSWVTTGGQTYIHRADGLAPASNNTLITRNIDAARFTAWGQDAYFEGLDFEGGTRGAIVFTAQAERALAADNCSFSYGGYPGFRVNGTEIYGASGLVYFRDCSANANFKDGLGFHGNAAAQLYALTYRCSAHRNGVDGGVSINAHTIHENILAVDIASTYSGGTYDGSVCHNVHTSQVVFIGTRMEMLDSPDAIDAAVRTGAGSLAWLSGCTIISDNNAVYEDATAQIEFQNCAITGTVTGASVNWQPQEPWGQISTDVATLSIGVRFAYGPLLGNASTLASLSGGGASDTLDIRRVGGGDVTDVLVRAGGVVTADTGPGVTLSTQRLMASARLLESDFAVSFSGNPPDKNARNGGAAPSVQTLEVPAVPAAMYLDYSAVYDTAFTDAQLQSESGRTLFDRDQAPLDMPDVALGISHTAPSLQVGILSIAAPDPRLVFSGAGFLAHPSDIGRRYAPNARRGAFMPYP